MTAGPHRVQPLVHRGGPGIAEGLHPGANEGTVQRFVELGYILQPLERRARMILSRILDLPRLETDVVGRFMAVRIAGRVVDLHLIETRLQRPDLIETFKNRAMLQARHASRDEDAQMPDMRVRQVDDALPGLLEVLGISVDDRRFGPLSAVSRAFVVTGAVDNEDQPDDGQERSLKDEK